MHHPISKYAALGAVIAAAAWAGPAAASQLDDIKARGTIVCGTQNASAPDGYQDPATREYVGYDVDMCKAVAGQMGLKVQHKPVSTEARIPEVKMGRVDMMAGAVAWLPKRAEQVDFSDQYLQGYIKVLVKEDSGIKTLVDLKDKKVCASSGSSSAAIAQKVLPDAQVLTFQNISQCYVGLQSGKVAALPARAGARRRPAGRQGGRRDRGRAGAAPRPERLARGGHAHRLAGAAHPHRPYRHHRRAGRAGAAGGHQPGDRRAGQVGRA